MARVSANARLTNFGKCRVSPLSYRAFWLRTAIGFPRPSEGFDPEPRAKFREGGSDVGLKLYVISLTFPAKPKRTLHFFGLGSIVVRGPRLL